MGAVRSSSVVVIGGTSGIGLRVAQLAAAEGALVTVGGRRPDRVELAATQLSSSGATAQAGVVDADDPASLEEFFAWLGPFDHLVSTIGSPMGGGFLSATLAEIRASIESKFFANLHIARIAAATIRDGGSITFTGGTGGRAQDAAGSYVGNGAIRALAEGLAVELASRRIRVNVIAPTWMDTPLWDGLPAAEKAARQASFSAAIPLGRTATLDEIASGYLFVLGNEFVTGQQIAIDGGIMLGG